MTATSVTLRSASRELLTRPADEHFASFPALLASAERSWQLAEPVRVPARDVYFVAGDVEAGDPSIMLSMLDGRPAARPTPWAFSQAARLAGIPPGIVERIQPSTACRALNEAWRNVDGAGGMPSDRLALLEHGAGDVLTLRALTSTSYDRVYDAEVLGAAGEWLVAAGMAPTMPTINTDERGTNILGNTKPALFRGDRSCYAFFSTPPGGDDFGGLSKGVILGNSEVGAAPLLCSDFLFRGMCANFLIWGAERVRSMREVHARGAARRFFETSVLRRLREVSAEIEPGTWRTLQAAAEHAFVADGFDSPKVREEAVSRLRTMGATEALATAAVGALGRREIAPTMPEHRPVSFWTVANAVTWAAKDTAFADDVVAAGRLAEKIVRAAPRHPRRDVVAVGGGA